jgi:hypothetical protein
MRKVQAFKTDHPIPNGAKFLSSFKIDNQVHHYFLVETKDVNKPTKLEKKSPFVETPLKDKKDK